MKRNLSLHFSLKLPGGKRLRITYPAKKCLMADVKQNGFKQSLVNLCHKAKKLYLTVSNRLKSSDLR